MRPPESRTCQDPWPERGCERFFWMPTPGPGLDIPKGCGWTDAPSWGREAAWASGALSPSGEALGGGGGTCSHLAG